MVIANCFINLFLTVQSDERRLASEVQGISNSIEFKSEEAAERVNNRFDINQKMINYIDVFVLNLRTIVFIVFKNYFCFIFIFVFFFILVYRIFIEYTLALLTLTFLFHFIRNFCTAM